MKQFKDTTLILVCNFKIWFKIIMKFLYNNRFFGCSIIQIAPKWKNKNRRRVLQKFAKTRPYTIKKLDSIVNVNPLPTGGNYSLYHCLSFCFLHFPDFLVWCIDLKLTVKLHNEN